MTDPGFALYIHWPFCLSKCPYCDFNSHAAASVDQERWRRALLREMAHYAAATPGRQATSLFFGGGTPSLMDPATAAAVIEAAGVHWSLPADAEITLEANPGTVDAERFRGFRAAGINRLSLGVQALNDEDLRFLGRRHDAAEALAAVALAGRLFPRFSFDLIYARPGQTPDGWEAELRRALTLAGDHLSLYQLTIEPGTAFHPAHQRGEFVLPDEDASAAMFEVTQAVTAAAGLPAYEVSNHAAPGMESRHNLTYWLGGDYVGVGPGAHGRIGLSATRQHRAPEIWLSRVEACGHATQVVEPLTPAERAAEQVMMGLRLTDGIRRAPAIDAVLDAQGLRKMVDGGFLEATPERLKATAKGRLMLNAMLAEVLA